MGYTIFQEEETSTIKGIEHSSSRPNYWVRFSSKSTDRCVGTQNTDILGIA